MDHTESIRISAENIVFMLSPVPLTGLPFDPIGRQTFGRVVARMSQCWVVLQVNQHKYTKFVTDWIKLQDFTAL